MFKFFKTLLLSLVLISIFSSIFFVNFEGAYNSTQISCGRYVKDDNVFIDNVIWQILETPFGFMHLLNAYLDERWNRTIVRVNVLAPLININTHKFFCQFWFDENLQPIVVEASEYQTLWFNITKSPSRKYPYLITCPILFNQMIPHSVSLTLNRCDNAENKLKIIDNKPIDGVKKEFGVCVKQLTYQNRSFITRFIEWVELLKILGADKIYFYNRLVHPDLIKVVEYFESQGRVDMKPFLEPSGVSNVILRKAESFVLEAAVVNDCFYRTKNLYKHIAILDPDEVIMPLNSSVYSWHDLMRSAKPNFDVYNQRMVTYPQTEQKPFEGIPEYNYMLQHVHRIKVTKYHKNKAFISTDNVIVAFVHGAYLCYHNSTFNAKCTKYHMQAKSSLVHYRHERMKEETNETIMETSIWKFKDELIDAVNKTLIATSFNP